MMDVTRKGELIAIDLMTPGPVSRNGNRHLLVITEYATKYAMAIPIKDKTAMTVADALWDHWICYFGTPERLISDNGGEFTGEDMGKALIEVSKIRAHTTTPYNPRANGQVERFNKTLANGLAKFIGNEEQANWDSYVATVCMTYNTTKHSATGETPFYLMFGQEAKTSLDELLKTNVEEKFNSKKWKEEKVPTMLQRMKYAQEKRKLVQEKNARRKNKDKENKVYQLGEKVWIREEPRTDKDNEEHKKLKLPWIGPFEISKADTKQYGNSYEVKRMLEGIEDKRVVNVSNIKEYIERPEWMQSENDWSPMTMEEK
jgi:hypothetical protein